MDVIVEAKRRSRDGQPSAERREQNGLHCPTFGHRVMYESRIGSPTRTFDTTCGLSYVNRRY